MRILKSIIWAMMAICLVQAAEIPENVKQHVRDRIDKQVNPAIVVALIDSDGVDFFSYGLTKLTDGTEVNQNHVFEIGSISKTFTTLLLADMVSKGEVKLDDPIEKYLPEGVRAPQFNGKSITLADLATHRSSMPRMPNNFNPADPRDPYADYTEKLLYEFVNGLELEREIGSQQAYSNVGMGLLGCLLGRAADTDFTTLVTERVFKPLGMNQTWMRVNDENRSKLAFGHHNGNQVLNWELGSMVAAGAIKSTAADMVRYISAQMGVQKSKLYDAMKQTQQEYKDYEMGLGWMFEGDSIIHHGGATGGYRAFSAFLRDGSKGVVVLTNSTEGASRIGLHLLDSEHELGDVKQNIGIALKDFEKQGAQATIAKYLHLKVNYPDDYEFGEVILNRMGYKFLEAEKVDDAIAIFELNVSEYPSSSNPYDSLGEAFMTKGINELAIMHYEKSLELNPANTNAVTMLEKMGVTYKPKEMKLTAEELAPYLGRYELRKGLIFTVTEEDAQLMVQLTGQRSLPVFASSKDHFFSKAVDAQISFNRAEDGSVDSLTLHQNGNHNAPRLAD